MYSAAEEGYSNIINMLIKANAKIDSICKVSYAWKNNGTHT